MINTSLGLAFITGVLSSFGPCAVPRMMAVLSLAIEDMRGLWLYGLGLASAYVVLALGVTVIQRALALSSVLIGVMALLFLLIGLQSLLTHSSASHHVEVPGPSPSAFVLGFSSACILSPCCMPILTGFVIGTPLASVTSNALSLLAFAIGQNLPVAMLGYLRFKQISNRLKMPFAEAVHIVSAALCIATGAYYALLIV